MEEQEEEKKIQISIRTLHGQSTQIMMEPQQTVADLKKLLQQQHCPPMASASSPPLPAQPLQFHLFLRGSKMDARTSLRSLSLQEGEFVVLIPFTKRRRAFTSFPEAFGPFEQGSKITEFSGFSLKDEKIGGGDECLASSTVCDADRQDCSHKEAASAVCSMSSGLEARSSESKPVSLSSTCASEFVWNAIAEDMSAWKLSLNISEAAFFDADISDTVEQVLTQGEHELGGMHDFMESAAMNKTMKCKQRVSSHLGTAKRQKKGFGVDYMADRDYFGNALVDAAEDYINSEDRIGRMNGEGSEASIEKGCISHHLNQVNVVKSNLSNNSKGFKGSWSFSPLLERLNRVFMALNAVSGFLQKQHMQGTWKNMNVALQQFCAFEGEAVNVNDIEKLATLFPKLVHLSDRVGQGEDASFNIDLLDPSKLPQSDSPCSLHDVMPIELQKGIGPSDLLPSPGKGISERVIRSTIQKRQVAFQMAIENLVKQLQESPRFMKIGLDKVTWDELLSIVKHLSKTNTGDSLDPIMNARLPRPPRPHKKIVRCKDTMDLSVSEMVEHLKKGLGSLGQIVHCEIIKARDAKYGQLFVTLSKQTEAALDKLHISRLYIHQTEAINAAVSGQSVIVATSTASGKSVCYNIPVLEELFSNLDSCALYLFPTKALAQDQLRALLEMTNGQQSLINMGIYDGDTPQHMRLRLRDHARLLITNPDMLHVSILSSHKQFGRFFSNLRYVVVDEAHAYRGAFGCHTALILRRLRRLCHHLYGTEPTFIVSSATVANPREHAMELIGLRSIQIIQEDGSPCGEKLFALWNPPTYFSTKLIPRIQKSQEANRLDKLRGTHVQQLYARRSSPMVELSTLQAEMVQHNLRCISFCKTRKSSELVLNYTKEILKETAPSLVSTICAYRAGYTAQERRDIEADLFGGKLRAVAATNALELGVDVGSLDATLHLGFPGTVASLWQQAGRAGRREKSSLSVYVAFESPLDQHFMKNPQKLFSRPIEHAQIDACNAQVLEEHLACAAFEYPLHVKHDEEFFGSGLESSISELLKKGNLGRQPDSCSQDDPWHYIGQEKFPSQSVNIRAIDPEKYTVINQTTNQVIEEVEESKAFFEVYEGAVYIHQGKTYLVKTLDLAAKVALCQEADVKYYTKTRDFTDVHIIGGELAYPGKISDFKYPTTTAQASICKVTTRWIGFRRIWQGTNETFDSVDLFLPDYSYDSQAVWIRVPHQIREELDAKGFSFRAGLHAASHALINIMPLYIMCNSSDLGTECANPHDTRYFPERLLIFDRHPGGIGIVTQARPLFAELLQAALELLVSCECTTDVGCPNCVQYLACSEYNEVIHKQAAIFILQAVIHAEDSYRQCKQENTK